MRYLLEIAEFIRDVRILIEELDEVIGRENIIIFLGDTDMIVVGFDLRAFLGASALVLFEFLFELAGWCFFLIENA